MYIGVRRVVGVGSVRGLAAGTIPGNPSESRQLLTTTPSGVPLQPSQAIWANPSASTESGGWRSEHQSKLYTNPARAGAKMLPGEPLQDAPRRHRELDAMSFRND